MIYCQFFFWEYFQTAYQLHFHKTGRSVMTLLLSLCPKTGVLVTCSLLDVKPSMCCVQVPWVCYIIVANKRIPVSHHMTHDFHSHSCTSCTSHVTPLSTTHLYTNDVKKLLPSALNYLTLIRFTALKNNSNQCKSVIHNVLDNDHTWCHMSKNL